MIMHNSEKLFLGTIITIVIILSHKNNKSKNDKNPFYSNRVKRFLLMPTVKFNILLIQCTGSIFKSGLFVF